MLANESVVAYKVVPCFRPVWIDTIIISNEEFEENNAPVDVISKQINQNISILAEHLYRVYRVYGW